MGDIDPALVEKAADAVFAEYQQVYQERLGHPVDPEDLPDRYATAKRYARVMLHAVRADVRRQVAEAFLPLAARLLHLSYDVGEIDDEDAADQLRSLAMQARDLIDAVREAGGTP